MCFEQPGYLKKVFQHKWIHKASWVSPDLSTENQTDRVCIGRKLKRSLQDVCVKLGADVVSDQHPLIVKLKLKLKRNWTRNSCQRPRYDTIMLLTGKIVLLNKFQVLEELLEEETINER